MIYRCPLPAREWATPFLEQAREDLRATRSLVDTRADCASTFLMLLQMAFEKLAKAAFAEKSQVVPRQHEVVSLLFAYLKRSASGRELLRISPNVEAFVVLLEQAHPAVAGRYTPPAPQLEYPWEDETTDTISYPSRNLYLADRVRNPRDRIGLDTLLFAETLASTFPNWLP